MTGIEHGCSLVRTDLSAICTKSAEVIYRLTFETSGNSCSWLLVDIPIPSKVEKAYPSIFQAW